MLKPLLEKKNPFDRQFEISMSYSNVKVNLPFQRLKQGLAARSAPASVKGFMLLVFVKS